MLEIKNISVEAEDKEIVRDVSLSVKEKSLSVLMGPNGSGKSSLVNALFGHPHYKISKGKILLGGKDITKLSTEEKAQSGLFLSLQHVPRIGGVTLATFLHKAYTSLHDSDISVLEFYSNMKDEAEKYGIDGTLLDRPLTAGLSGGEKKLSEILQLIALKPKYAFLDEIDSGVDIDALHKVFGAIDALKKNGTAFVVISHHPSLLDHFTPESVHVMSEGKLVRTDGHELASEIIQKGFCAVAECKHKDTCPGVCGGEK